MSDETNPLMDEMDCDRTTDVIPAKPVPAGFFDATVAGVRVEGPNADRPDTLFPECMIARVTYRLDSEDPELNGKRVDDFPMPVKGHEQSWKWFDWCGKMGYDTKQAFRFSASDVEGAKVSLKFGPPREGKGKNAGKQYSNLESVQRLQ